MWTKALDAMLTHLFREGGTPSVAVTLKSADLPRRLIMSPDLAVGEAYMNGDLVIENDDLYGFLSVAIQNKARQGQPWFRKPLEILRHMGRSLQQFNPAARSKSNVAHHYDLSGELYDLFLDEDRQYSCAYFAQPDMTLEQAQAAKKHHIAGKLLLEPDMEVFEIGCGWGGMALTLARDYGVRGLGVTLSTEQHKVASERAEAAGLSDRVRF